MTEDPRGLLAAFLLQGVRVGFIKRKLSPSLFALLRQRAELLVAIRYYLSEDPHCACDRAFALVIHARDVII